MTTPAKAPYRIHLYDEIGMWGVNASDFASLLRGADGGEIELHIQSPGGSVSDGFAIANLLKAYAGRKVAVIDGFCASAATFAAMVCDEVHMHAQSLLMIHDPSGAAAGCAEDLDTMADLLRSISSLMSDLYQKKTGASAETVAAWLSKDSWFTPAEALAAKLVDKVIETPAKTAKASARTMQFLARCKNPPPAALALLNPPTAAAPPVVPVPSIGVKKMKSTAITRGLLVALSGFAHYAALASASADPEEKALGEHLRALDLTAPTAALAEVKAPSLGDLFAVHAKAVELTGSDKGICGGLDALAQNSSARGAAASLSRMALVDQMLAAAVNPQPDASGVTPPRKLTPAMAAGQRAQFVASADKPIDDLASFIRLAHPLPALNQVEDAGSGSAADLAAGDIDPEYARHANAGKIAGGAQ